MGTVPLPPLPLKSAEAASPAEGGVLTHYPDPPPETAAAVGITTAESLLSDWFDRPVVLLGSGRAGIHLFMKVMGLSRYRDQVLVPPYLSTCVTDTLVRHAFPVPQSTKSTKSAKSANPGLILLYHQYGLPQRKRLAGTVLEDICHRFFAGAGTGARDWMGEAAVFSLPKFFGIAGMGGGIAVQDRETARRIRELRDGAEEELPGIREWMRTVIAATYRNPAASPLAPLLESAYALLVRYPRPDEADLAGFPADRNGIAAIGKKRSMVVSRLIEALGRSAAPDEIIDGLGSGVPFAFPYFGTGDRAWLEARNSALSAAGIHAGVYNVDVRMTMENPEYRPCILLPCHQDVGERQIETMARILHS